MFRKFIIDYTTSLGIDINSQHNIGLKELLISISSINNKDLTLLVLKESEIHDGQKYNQYHDFWENPRGEWQQGIIETENDYYFIRSVLIHTGNQRHRSMENIRKNSNIENATRFQRFPKSMYHIFNQEFFLEKSKQFKEIA